MTLAGFLTLAAFAGCACIAAAANAFLRGGLRRHGVQIPQLLPGMTAHWYLKNRISDNPARLRNLAVTVEAASITAVLLALIAGPFVWN
jgi:hypothetical protein